MERPKPCLHFRAHTFAPTLSRPHFRAHTFALIFSLALLFILAAFAHADPISWNANTQGQFVTCACRDLQNRLWVGTEDGQGLWQFDPAAKAWTHFPASPQLSGDIYALAVDKAGRLWAGGLAGVSVYNGQAWKQYGPQDGPLGTRLFALAVSPKDGGVWGATEAGLFRYAHSRWTYYIQHHIFGGSTTVSLPKLTIAIPPTQVIYPFTPAPNVVNNANGAVGQGTFQGTITDPFAYPFWNDYCPGGSIGDWGKAVFYWPDLNYPQQYKNPYPGVSSPRRIGANFNFGAMAANAGMNLQIALLTAEKKANFKHPLAEQRAIDAGYNWWLSSPRQLLSNGATISVHLPDDDTHNLK